MATLKPLDLVHVRIHNDLVWLMVAAFLHLVLDMMLIEACRYAIVYIEHVDSGHVIDLKIYVIPLFVFEIIIFLNRCVLSFSLDCIHVVALCHLLDPFDNCPFP